jgi:hypothetical protein
MMAALGTVDGRLPTLTSEGWGVPRQFVEAAYQLWLLEPSLTNQRAETVVPTTPDDRLANVIGGFDVGMISARAARQRYGIPSLRETIALGWARTIELRDLTSGAAPSYHTSPELHDALITLGSAVTAAVRWATILTLLDPETPKDVQEGSGWLLASSSTPAWREQAKHIGHAHARQGALLQAIGDARQPQPRLRIGKKEYGQQRAPITLPAAELEAWVWQRARRYLCGKLRRKVVPTFVPEEDAVESMEPIRLLTMPNDENWPQDATPLLGAVVREIWDDLDRDNRDRILRTLKVKLRAAASD